ncbi:MAG: DUF308 domain-containing protein [Euryarchaeota archaeon]|nr:DUF308 domain-containing protein [Euryarchaeota archaeon]
MSDAQANVGYTGDIIKDWWALLWYGAFLLIFGVIAYIMSDMNLTDLTIWFAGLLLFSGIVFVAAYFKGTMLAKNKLQPLTEGIVYFILGLVVLLMAPDSEAMLMYFGIFALFAGLMRVVEAFTMNAAVKQSIGKICFIMLLVAGFLSLIVGIYVLVFPAESMLDILWAVGGYAIIYAGLVISAALSGSK